MLQSKGNVEQIGNLRGHSFIFLFVYIFFPPLYALYNKENTAWRTGGLEGKLAEMKTGL